MSYWQQNLFVHYQALLPVLLLANLFSIVGLPLFDCHCTSYSGNCQERFLRNVILAFSLFFIPSIFPSPFSFSPSFTDCTLPLWPCETRMWQVSWGWAGMVSGGTQEHGSLVLHPAQDSHCPQQRETSNVSKEKSWTWLNLSHFAGNGICKVS